MGRVSAAVDWSRTSPAQAGLVGPAIGVEELEASTSATWLCLVDVLGPGACRLAAASSPASSRLSPRLSLCAIRLSLSS